MDDDPPDGEDPLEESDVSWEDLPTDDPSDGPDGEGPPGSGSDEAPEVGSGVDAPDGDPERDDPETDPWPVDRQDSGGDEDGTATATDSGRSRANRVLTWILVIALVASLAGVVHVAVTPQQTGEPFTEFYVLGSGGNASDYPTNLTPGGTGEVIVGVSNHERRTLDYRVNVTWDGTVTQQETLTVPDGETRERRLTLTAPADPGTYRVRLVLYTPDESPKPYRVLRLFVTVNATDTAVGP